MSFEIHPGTIYSAVFTRSVTVTEETRTVVALSRHDADGNLRVAQVTKSPVVETKGFEITPDRQCFQRAISVLT